MQKTKKNEVKIAIDLIQCKPPLFIAGREKKILKNYRRDKNWGTLLFINNVWILQQ